MVDVRHFLVVKAYVSNLSCQIVDDGVSHDGTVGLLVEEVSNIRFYVIFDFRAMHVVHRIGVLLSRLLVQGIGLHVSSWFGQKWSWKQC